MKHLALLLLILVSACAYAQDSRGSVTGQVTDTTGAVIPKAQITVTSTDTGSVTRVTSTAESFPTARAISSNPQLYPHLGRG